jgi:hypothetical protein
MDVLLVSYPTPGCIGELSETDLTDPHIKRIMAECRFHDREYQDTHIRITNILMEMEMFLATWIKGLPPTPGIYKDLFRLSIYSYSRPEGAWDSQDDDAPEAEEDYDGATYWSVFETNIRFPGGNGGDSALSSWKRSTTTSLGAGKGIWRPSGPGLQPFWLPLNR